MHENKYSNLKNILLNRAVMLLQTTKQKAIEIRLGIGCKESN